MANQEQRFIRSLFDTSPVIENDEQRTIGTNLCQWISNVKSNQLTRFMATTAERNLITDDPKPTRSMTLDDLKTGNYVGVWQIIER